MNNNPFDVSGKTALVTGANSGIGLGMAEAIARAGGDLIIWGRRQEQNAEAAKKLRALGANVLAQTVDVGDEAQVKDAFSEAVKETGYIDATFANAGVSGKGTWFGDMATEDYMRVIRINQFGAMYTLRESARHMVERVRGGGPPGSLVGIASITSFQGMATQSAYASTKGAIVTLIKALAVEYGAFGIRANCIAPGMIRTDLGGGHMQSGALDEMVLRRTPMKRWGEPGDLGGPAVYLMSDASAFHTGDVLAIDGGWMVLGT